MLFDPPLVPARLKRRYKRFLADCELTDGRMETVHCPNPGSMLGLIEGEPVVHLSHHPGSKRKLAHGMELLELPGTLVGVNPVAANRFVAECLAAGTVPGLAHPGAIAREFRHGPGTRFDFEVTDRTAGRVLVEVKSVTLASGPVAYFPDAVTARGKKHLDELGKLAATGLRTMLIFWVNRSDCVSVRPADWIDPAYGRALRDAVDRGLTVVALGARVERTGIHLDRPLPVDLRPMTEWPDPPHFLSW